MKARLAFLTKNITVVGSLVAMLIVATFLTGCTKNLSSNNIAVIEDDNSLYSDVLKQALPTHLIENSYNSPYYHLEKGIISEAFDTQAVGALKTGIANYWYPQYLATVIIAINRDLTNISVTTWEDLFYIDEKVALYDLNHNVQMFMGAMSYGLEGPNYTLKKGIHLLETLHDNNLLEINSFDAPVIIAYDYQAVSLIEKGLNLDVIVPRDGTITYEKGLLSNVPLKLNDDINELLINSNLRTIDKQNNNSLYPNNLDYSTAVKVADYDHFAKTNQNAYRLIERQALNKKLFMSIGNREHILFAMISMMIVVIWTASIMRKSTQKMIRYSALSLGILLNVWILVRLIKYQIDLPTTFTRYLWYSFYLFQLLIPIILLWMAWSIDKPKDQYSPPKWLRLFSIVLIILIIFVFTNDIHGLVLNLDLTSLDWDINYSYGMGYYVVLFVSMMGLSLVFIILITKSLKNPSKLSFVFPSVIFIFFIIYTYKYINRDPFIYETDLTIITGMFTMLMFEACMYSGLIPKNTKYIKLFEQSPLKMQIINKDKEVVFKSPSATLHSKKMYEKAIAFSPFGIIQDNQYLLFANPIAGGYSVWEEDISKLFKLHKEIQHSSQMLVEANSILLKEEEIKRRATEEYAKNKLIVELESEISYSINQMSKMIQNLSNSKTLKRDTSRLALMMCYIKRRSNLFFKQKESYVVQSEKLILYIEELSEIAKYLNAKITILHNIKGDIQTRHTIIFYNLFYSIIELASHTNEHYIIEYLEDEKELTMRILASNGILILQDNLKFINYVSDAGGNFVVKDLDDMTSISISFLKDGAEYA